jgi:hypothetical protein
MPSARQARDLLLCYGLLPLVVAVLNALRGTVYAPEMSAADLVLFFGMMGIPSWTAAGLMAWMIVPRFAGGTRMDLALLCIAGLGGVVFSYFHLGLVVGTMAQTHWPSLAPFTEPGGYRMVTPLSDYIVGRSAAYFLALWLSANFVYRWLVPNARFLGAAPREVSGAEAEADGLARETAAGGDDKPEVAEQPHRPPFLRKLKQESAGPLIAIVAEEHYIRIYTETGSDLILYRFSDALHEIDGWQEGLQVHRSYWVASNAIVAAEQHGKSFRLTLSNGLKVPVSQANRGLVRANLAHLVAPQGHLVQGTV